MSEIKPFVEIPRSDGNQKRKWEYAFQHWSDEQLMDGKTPYGKCGYGSMCEYCEEIGISRPCIEALHNMLKETHKTVDYTDFDFTKVWCD